MIDLFHVSDLHIGKQTSGHDASVKRLLQNIEGKFAINGDPGKRLIVTGDLVDCNSEENYANAADCLSAFGKNVILIPGNHEYAPARILFFHIPGFGYKRDNALRFDDFVRQQMRDSPKNHASLDYVGKAELPHEVLIATDAGSALLILLNSNHENEHPAWGSQGILTAAQRTSLRRTLEKDEYANLPKILLLHHVPTYIVEESWQEYPWVEFPWMPLIDSDELGQIVRGHKIDALAFGHDGSMDNVSRYKILWQQKLFGTPRRRPQQMKVKRHLDDYLILDANTSLAESACYRIHIDGRNVSATREAIP
jgi:hypothetical protein